MTETVEEIRKRAFAETGREGGLKRARNLTKKQRSDSARKASLARWSKKAKAVA
jgi:hypothetical protein